MGLTMWVMTILRTIPPQKKNVYSNQDLGAFYTWLKTTALLFAETFRFLTIRKVIFIRTPLSIYYKSILYSETLQTASRLTFLEEYLKKTII